MDKLLRNVILKYSGIALESDKQNLLDLPVYEEVWVYIIIELEEKHKLPMLQVMEEINSSEFNLETICKKLELAS
ncbi:hypothetical protein GCM10008910_36260 [Faecalicatena orotica]|uniref:Uncharacterized protein n=1 Tax=Faecalicatena orotica TaxID=1544 RepID=A0A2Y9BF51_9FIRM|nr:hypothetical protein [Faecalicatena orotica]PWJ29749.1 hypothetical protein A8806_10549 [Faecalicatena orotica]SSA55473.1 hypothetical protein SAMN05216536_10549 [Faecalicatena orotica]